MHVKSRLMRWNSCKVSSYKITPLLILCFCFVLVFNVGVFYYQAFLAKQFFGFVVVCSTIVGFGDTVSDVMTKSHNKDPNTLKQHIFQIQEFIP